MTRLQEAVMAIFAALLLAGAAHAQVSLDSVRIEAKDTVALAKFYQAAFGMQEVNRIENPGGTEVFVNFGATVEAAKANKNPQMILFHRDSDDVKDPDDARDFCGKGHDIGRRRPQGRRWNDDGRSATVRKDWHRPRLRDRSGR